MNEYSEQLRKLLRDAGASVTGPAKEVACLEAALVRDAIMGANPSRPGEMPRSRSAEKVDPEKPVERATSPEAAKKDPLAALQAINAARAARGQQTANATASNGPQRGQGNFGPGFGGGYGGGFGGGGFGGGGFGAGHPVPLGPFHGHGLAQPRGALRNPRGQAHGGFGPGVNAQGSGSDEEEEDY